MKWTLVLLCIGLVAASPLDTKTVKEALLNGGATRNSLLEERLINLLEDLRSTMLTGSETVPVMDPLQVKHLLVDDSVVPLPGLKLELADTVINKLSTFVIDELTLQSIPGILAIRYRANIDLAVPVLELDAAHYDLFAKVDTITIFGTGDAKINIIEPRVSGHVVARVRLGLFALYLQLEECEIKFTLKAFEPQINGLLSDDPMVNDFVNAFLRFFIPDLVKLYEEQITKTLSTTVMQIGNELLSDLNLISILG